MSAKPGKRERWGGMGERISGRHYLAQALSPSRYPVGAVGSIVITTVLAIGWTRLVTGMRKPYPESK